MITGGDFMHFYKSLDDHFFIQLDTQQFQSQDFHSIVVEEHQGDETKHQPIITQNQSTIHVKIGNIMHPMSEEHHISMIFLKTKQGGQYKILSRQETPIVEFELSKNDQPIAVYGYCNLHGLWKEECS
jgi:superoxide reductase